jgi:uncharacterized coiled-coil protein SlyX
MTHVAAIPSWMIFVFVMAFMGPALRYMFGREPPFGLGGKWEGKGRLQKRDAERLDAALAERDAVIEDLQHRLSEMESRLDFTERLIAQKAEDDRPAVR